MKILYADNCILFRDSLAVALQTVFAGCVIKRLSGWQEVIDEVAIDDYDLILVDLLMSGNDLDTWSVPLSQVIRSKNKGAVCAIASTVNQAYVRQAYQAGASGYICKTFTLKQVEKILLQAMSGRLVIPEQVWSGPSVSDDCQSGMTSRQREVLELLATGACNKSIARRLKLSESTVKRHAYNLYRALGAKNRADAVRIGHRQGLLGH